MILIKNSLNEVSNNTYTTSSFAGFLTIPRNENKNLLSSTKRITGYNEIHKDAIVLTIITIIGRFGNFLTILIILFRRSLRNVRNMFLLHHCFINFMQSIICIPFVISLLTHAAKLNGCEVFSGAYVTLVTAGIVNVAAMTASEAYYFEDLILKSHNKKGHPMNAKKQNFALDSNKKSSSCRCVIFGVVMIWLTSIILHLGITMIGSDPKLFYNHEIRNCFFIIGDRRTFVLYVMWVVVTLLSVIFIVKYVIKIFKDIVKHRHIEASSCLKTSSVISRNRDIDFLNFLLKHRLDTGNNKNLNKMGRKRKSGSLPISYSASNHLSSSVNQNTSQSNVRSLSMDNLISNKEQTTNLNLEIIEAKQYHNSTKVKYKRNFDLIKQTLQKIKIQLVLVLFFIICWLPLFITVILGSVVEIPPIAYKYLTMIACTNSSITPYCYLTVLIPQINKFCFPCLRSDGKQNIHKSKLYDAITSYYDKIGDRFHNFHVSTNSINSIIGFKSNETNKKRFNNNNLKTSFGNMVSNEVVIKKNNDYCLRSNDVNSINEIVNI